MRDLLKSAAVEISSALPSSAHQLLFRFLLETSDEEPDKESSIVASSSATCAECYELTKALARSQQENEECRIDRDMWREKAEHAESQIASKIEETVSYIETIKDRDARITQTMITDLEQARKNDAEIIGQHLATIKYLEDQLKDLKNQIKDATSEKSNLSVQPIFGLNPWPKGLTAEQACNIFLAHIAGSNSKDIGLELNVPLKSVNEVLSGLSNIARKIGSYAEMSDEVFQNQICARIHASYRAAKKAA